MLLWIILLAAIVIGATYAVCSMVTDYKAIELFDYWTQGLKRDHEMDSDWTWGLLEGAHKRRKRVEKILRRERLRSAALFQKVAELYQEGAELRHQLRLQEMRNQSLAADLAAAILNSEDKAKVREGLVRKIR